MTSLGEFSLSSSDELEDDNKTPRGSEKTKEKKTTDNQTLDVVKSLTDSFKSSLEALNTSLNNNFQILGENFHVLNESMQQFAYYPEVDTHEEASIEHIEEENEIPDKSEQPKDDNNASQETIEKPSEEVGLIKSLLASLEKKSSSREKTGPKLNEVLAKNITALMRQKPEDDMEKNVLDKINRPENCAGLTKVKVNQVIWDRISAEARTTDVKMQRVQTALVKGTTCVALVANKILNLVSDKDGEKKQNIEQELNGIWQTTEDALVCLGAANWELSQRRRDLLKSQISKEYGHLCAQKVPFTDMLFGENVTKQIKDITDDNKVTHKLLDQKYGWRRGSRGSTRGVYRGRANYRGSYNYARGRFQPYQRSFLGNSNNSRLSYSKGKTTSTETSKK